MKKIVFSALVIFTFAAYVVYQKKQANVEGIATINQQSQSVVTTSTPTPSESSSGTDSVPTVNPVAVPTGKYKDGTYTGSVADAFYGSLQVKTTITAGKISDVVFLKYPNDRGTSEEINYESMPVLKKEAIEIQDSNVDIVSGATQSSMAFKESLKAALDQAI